jgi:hypothetical protein
MIRSGVWVFLGGHPVAWVRPIADDARVVPVAIGTDHAPNLARNLSAAKMLTGVRPAVGVGPCPSSPASWGCRRPVRKALSNGGLSLSSFISYRRGPPCPLGIAAVRSLIALALATVVSAAPAHAQSWAESWFDNVTYTSPGSFEDQTRGYVTAGGMSGRSMSITTI